MHLSKILLVADFYIYIDGVNAKETNRQAFNT
jgi:hypothetical protein